MLVQDICSAKAVHVPLSCTLREAAVQMRARHVGALIVTENSPAGTPAVGMVTDRDIVIIEEALRRHAMREAHHISIGRKGCRRLP